MMGRMASLLSPSSIVVVLNHVLAVIPLTLMSWVLQPVGMLVTTPSESVEKNGIVDIVAVGVGEMGVIAGFAQGNVLDDETQPSVQGVCVVSIGIPRIELGSEHSNGIGEAV
jgi:hypothetical protein